MILVTHNDRFHADDACSMAVFKILLGDDITKVIRTRDEQIIKSADIVFDVGNIYDPDTNRFDHHQTGGAGERENGVPYASFGLIWKKFGKDVCGSQEVADMIDKKMIQLIDASDNGHLVYEYILDDIREYGLDTICASFGATWKESDEYDKSFFEVVDIFEKIIRREIKVAQDKHSAKPLVLNAYQEAEDKRIVVLEEYYPWSDVLTQYTEVMFVLSPSKDKTQWRVQTIQDANFINRKDFPKEWAGLQGEELEKVSGVRGAKFCHRGLFLAVGDSRESAIALAQKALEV